MANETSVFGLYSESTVPVEGVVVGTVAAVETLALVLPVLAAAGVLLAVDAESLLQEAKVKSVAITMVITMNFFILYFSI